MKMRRHAAGALAALFCLISVSGTGDRPAVSAQTLPAQSVLMEAIAGKQTALDGGETEFCLTLAAPSISESMKSGLSEAEASQAVLEAQQAVSKQVLSITGTEPIAASQYLVNTLTVRADAVGQALLGALPGVSSIAPSRRYTLPVMPVSTADATAEWSQPSAETADAGEGKVIAVIDTGIDPGHEAMALDDPSAVKINESRAREAIAELGYGGYYSEKIPFYFNYADGNLNILDENNEQHGMHVAGICAGNSNSLQGSAPQAQILAMRVFGEESNSAADYAIVAAIEDAVRLGADVINLSLGSPSGFTDIGSEPYQKAVQMAREQGVILVVSAGNEGKSNVSGDDYIREADLPDNGTIGSPATYDGFVPVAAALDKFSLAYFSSYGPAPDLTFAPYLAAPGVAIRSSVNFNQYALKSGTSMAAPCIAGVFAALSGALEQKGLLPSGEERAQRLTALLMNTAIPLENEDGLVPVRGQGAGVYRTDRASVSTAIALGESGDPFVELGKLPANVNGRTVTLTLQNFGSAPVRYSIPAQTVYTEDTAAPSQRCVAIPGARWTPSADSVEVPAGQSVQVTFTLETAADLAGYLEGYFCLIGEGVPDLNVPYLGFCGDERGPMVLTQGELAPTMMALTMDGETPSFEPAGALSPNADGYCDVLVPFYFQLRNAQRVDYSILDADYQTVTECAQVVGVPKDLYQSCVDDGLAGKFDLESPQPMLALTGWYYDAHATQYVLLDSGFYVLRATLHGDDDTETIDMPFVVDTQAPRITEVQASGSGADAILSFSEPLYSRTGGPGAALFDLKTGELLDNSAVEQTDDTTLAIAADHPIRVGLAVADQGMNLSLYAVTVSPQGASALPLESAESPATSAAGPAPNDTQGFEWLYGPPPVLSATDPRYDASTGRVTFVASCNPAPQTVRCGIEGFVWRTADQNRIEVEIPVKEGYNAFMMTAATEFGDLHLGGAFLADLTPPEITLLDEALPPPDWMAETVAGLLPPSETPRDIHVRFSDNQAYGLQGMVNGTDCVVNGLSGYDFTVETDCQEGTALILQAMDLSNVSDKVYLFTDGDLTLGDINRDGAINAADALKMLQFAVDLIPLDGAGFVTGDVNASESVDTMDALLVLQYTVGLISEF